MADWKMSSEPHDGILLAKKWADLGAQAHPKSLGAKKCRDLLAQISRPSLSMRSMRIDGSSRPSIEVRFKGIQKLYFRSYRIDLGVRMLEKKQNGALYSRDEVEALVQSAKPAYSWTSDLRAIQDFKPHQAHITPPTHAHGFYFVATSTDPQFSVKSLRADAVICFSDLVLRTSVKKETQTREVTVVNGMSGRGMPGVSLELYQFDYNTAPRLVQKFDSDSQGVVQFKQPSSDRG